MSYLTREQQLAMDAWQLIYNDPSLLEQKTWRSAVKNPRSRCGTKLCWGGHVVALDNGVFFMNDSNSKWYDHVLARSTDKKAYVKRIPLGSDYNSGALEVISVQNRLASIFGMTPEELEIMTNGHNSVEEIREGIKTRLGFDPKWGTKVVKDESPAYSEPKRRCGCNDPYCNL